MSTSELICLRCRTPLDPAAESCPQCSEKVTQFQRTYSTRLIDGKYQILDRLGVGGMGEIFKVRHIHLNEQRVIKIMRANIATDDQALQRFLYEAKLSTTVKHRNLAMLYDFATLDDGSYYMVWEFIDGVNIQKWISKNGPTPPRLAVEIAIQALAGLAALHEMGIIHRDISPENIMLSQDRQGRLLVKVIDFGIAKQLSEGEGGHGLTQTGMFLGKLKYASPEQAGFIREGENARRAERPLFVRRSFCTRCSPGGLRSSRRIRTGTSSSTRPRSLLGSRRSIRRSRFRRPSRPSSSAPSRRTATSARGTRTRSSSSCRRSAPRSLRKSGSASASG